MPDSAVTRGDKAPVARIAAARRERVSRILAKVRAIGTPDVLDDAGHSAAWYPLAAVHLAHARVLNQVHRAR